MESRSRLRSSPNLFLNWEIGATILVLAAAFVCAWPELRGMASASLWQDNYIASPITSSHRPLFTATHYREVNNHIFLNILSSLVPRDNYFAPTHARFLPYAFTFLTVLAMQRGGQVVGLGMIVDRSGGQHPNFGCPFLSLVAMNVETFAAGNLPADLRAISAVKPGSR